MTFPESHSWEGTEPGFEPSPLASESLFLNGTPRAGHLICRAQCTVKMPGPLFTSCEFHVRDSRALNGAQGPDCTGHMPTKLAPATQAMLATVSLITVSYSSNWRTVEQQNSGVSRILAIPELQNGIRALVSLLEQGPEDQEKIKHSLANTECWSWKRSLNQPVLQMWKWRP